MTSTSAAPAAAGAVGALLAVSRLLAVKADASPQDLDEAIVGEARACFAGAEIVLVAQDPGRRVRVVAGDAPPRTLDLDEDDALAELLDRRVRLLRRPDALLLLVRAADGLDGALVVRGLAPGARTDLDDEIACAFADAAAAALDRLRAAAEHERQVAQQQALTRAAKTLTDSLDLDTVLTRICHEAASILGCTIATVYRGSRAEGMVVAAAHGMPPEAVGWRLAAGAGLAGKVLLSGRAMLTNDYRRIADLPQDAPIPPADSAMAAPMVWDGELRGVLSVGFEEPRGVTHDDLAVLETLAELAASACANASAHAGLQLAARTDGLTGCLNHAALHEGLRREIERATRGDGAPLSLILLDLDDFKQVNEAHGHLVGDEVLRRAGHALRHATRPYDLAARYGGDEFALVAVEADEVSAADVADRALERVADAIRDLLPEGATAGTAGVAEWSPGIAATELLARADRALLFAKQSGFRGRAFAFSAVPDHFRPGRFSRSGRGLPDPPPMPRPPAGRHWPSERADERLRKRTRQLALANALGARLAAMTDPDAILDATVDELHRAFGYFCAAVIRVREDGMVEAAALRGAPFLRLLERRWCQAGDVGLIGRCLLTRRPVLSNDVRSEPDYQPTAETGEVNSELVVPLWVGDDLWGAINLEELLPGAFDEDDVTLAQTLAALVGSAMRSAVLYAQLERTYRGTAEALAAALEAKDA